MYYFQEIKDQGLLDLHVAQFVAAVGVHVPTAYFKDQGITFGLFDAGHKLVGGYSLIVKSPLRGIDILPCTVKEHSTFLQNVSPDDMLEINGVWLARSVRSPRVRLSFWMHAVYNIRRCGKKYVLIFYNAHVSHFAKLYQAMSPREIFRGNSAVSQEVTSHSCVYVGYSSMRSVRMAQVLGPLTYYWLWLSRMRMRLGKLKPALT